MTAEINIVKNIKKYRAKPGISQDVLSKRANFCFHTMAKIEVSSMPDPRIETLKKIAKALHIPIEDLIKRL